MTEIESKFRSSHIEVELFRYVESLRPQIRQIFCVHKLTIFSVHICGIDFQMFSSAPKKG